MSAFMMSEESLAKIAVFIRWNLDNRQPDVWLNPDIKKTLHNACKAVNTGKVVSMDVISEANLYRALELMNAEALRQRYGDELKDNISGSLPAFPWYKNLHRVEVYKAIRCYLYQCAEGDVHKSPLYKAVAEIAEALADAIISDMPEYEAANWG